MRVKSLFQIKKEIWEEKEKYFKNYKFYCQILRERAEKIMGESRIIVFGSVVRGDFTPDSDIDVLIISDNLPESYEERLKIKAKLKSSMARLNPFQLHLATQKEFEEHYKPFIKEDYEEIL